MPGERLNARLPATHARHPSRVALPRLRLFFYLLRVLRALRGKSSRRFAQTDLPPRMPTLEQDKVAEKHQKKVKFAALNKEEKEDLDALSRALDRKSREESSRNNTPKNGGDEEEDAECEEESEDEMAIA